MRGIESLVIAVHCISSDISHGITVNGENGHPAVLLIHHHQSNAVCPGFISILGGSFQLACGVHTGIENICDTVIILIFLTFVNNISITVAHIVGVPCSNLHRFLLCLFHMDKNCCKQSYSQADHQTDDDLFLIYRVISSFLFHSS